MTSNDACLGLLEENSSKISSQFDLKRRRPWDFCRQSLQQEENNKMNNKMSSDMRSVPDLT